MSLKYIDLTLPTPQRNIACDEALIDLCENGYDHEILRFWEPREYFVVVGYSSKIELEVNMPSCRKSRIPILRRCSGGGTVLQGPGCLNYSLVLKIWDSAPRNSVSETNAFIMKCHKEALQEIIGSEIGIQGFSDLALGMLKFSGNAQYRKKHFLLFHGTILLQLDIRLVEELLLIPSRQPRYRQGRSHEEFLTNLNVPPRTIKEALQKSWNAEEELKNVPFEKIDRLVRKQYSTDEWNFKF